MSPYHVSYVQRLGVLANQDTLVLHVTRNGGRHTAPKQGNVSPAWGTISALCESVYRLREDGG